ncbi:hypothetical protein BBP40_000901 [Aspergillus hancockii]|nr:hypothetical protein BBP40_000901 [Aspergillus hancockii]
MQVISDLHREDPLAYDIFSIIPKAPFLALLSDTGYVKDAGFFNFLYQQLAAFRIILLILGSHEPEKIHGASPGDEELGELIALDKTLYDISPTITIRGFTLVSHVTQDQSESVSFGLNDFYHIRD